MSWQLGPEHPDYGWDEPGIDAPPLATWSRRTGRSAQRAAVRYLHQLPDCHRCGYPRGGGMACQGCSNATKRRSRGVGV